MSEIGITNVQRVSFITYCLITITAALQYCLIVCMQHGALHAGNLYYTIWSKLAAKERCGDDVIWLLLLLLLLIIIKTVLTVPNSESVSAMHHPSPRLDGLYF